MAGTSLLALANATKYATAVLDPAVVALAAITVTRRRGLKPGFVRSGHLAAGTLGLVSALLALGGPWYLSGVLSTTLLPRLGKQARVPGPGRRRRNGAGWCAHWPRWASSAPFAGMTGCNW